MKLLGKNIAEKDGSGTVTVIPNDAEDMWHVYNLLFEGDMLTAKSVRKVQRESATGSTESERVKMTITISVLSVDFNPGAEVIRVLGRNCTENKFIKNGAHHTHELILNKKFTIYKDCWDAVALERIEDACNPAKAADLACIVMSEGLAHICLVTSQMTILRARIDTAIPGKRKGRSMGHDKGMNRFFKAVLEGMLRHIDFSVVKCVLIGSPGYVKDDYYKFMMQQAQQREIKAILENKSVFVLSHASSGHMQALKEMLVDPNVASDIKDTKAALDVRALHDFYQGMKDDPEKTTYGPKHVLQAGESGAIQTLLITDNLFRSSDLKTRKQYVALVEAVREMGGDVRIFSTQHMSGQSLEKVCLRSSNFALTPPDFS
mmetsp:Transcript_18425/g.52016  ORF Transcript_18425/g.52016 Transcript_18425/m.52016 type:complete len:376 (-) Transcript_18425:1195-2322(-)